MERPRLDFDELILRIHTAPLEPDRWPGLVADLANLVRADSAALFALPGESRSVPWLVPYELGLECFAEYADSFGDQDEYLIGSIRQKRCVTGVVSVAEDLIDRRSLLRTSFYNDFLRKWDMDRFMNVCLRGQGSEQPPVMTLSFFGGMRHGGFEPTDMTPLVHLAPHLILAARQMWHARGLALQTSIGTHALEQLAVPVIAIDALDRPVFTNTAAEAVIRASRWITVNQGRIEPTGRFHEQRQVFAALVRLRRGMASTILLTDTAGARAALMTSPLADRHQAGIQAATGLVWLVPLEPDAAITTQLSQLFMLTAAEARLVHTLVEVSALNDAADRLHISRHTARAQLKSVFRKIGCRTQGQLLALTQRMASIRHPQ